jgi:L-fucose isomerase-like protein
MKFGYIPAVTGLLEKEDVMLEEIGHYFASLNDIGGERLTRDQTDNPKPLFYFLVSGGTENKVLQLRANRSLTSPGEPVYLIAHPGNNSLPACLEVLARLQQDGNQGRIFYIKNPEDAEGINQIIKALHDNEIMQSLKKARIGFVGTASDWLVASKPEAELVKQVWGPEIVHINFYDLKERIRKAEPEQLNKYKSSLIKSALEIKEPTNPEIDEVVKVYIALKQLTEELNLESITVRCFDLVSDLKTTGCYGLSQLMDDGIISGCEGDLNSTVAMLWANKMVGETPWMANPAQVDERNNRLWLAHCTVPRKMIQKYTLRSHFESGIGVGIQGTFNSQPVTIIRIGGKDMKRLWLAEGTLLQAGFAENLCRTQVEIELTSGGSVKDLLNVPLGNHLVMISGHHLQELKSWWELMINQG